MLYNWQQKDWPQFTYHLQDADDALLAFANETGLTGGMLSAIPTGMQAEAVIDNMVIEALKTSEIEGEYLSRKDVMSSVRNNLGLDARPHVVKDKKAQGAGQLMVDVRKTFHEPLTEATLFAWHKMLMADSKHVAKGQWRSHKEPMQVVSGALGREKVHFEAPPSSAVPKEMKRFLKWFNDTAPGGKQELKKAPVRAALAHLFFETVHPFEDGNGRVGRAIAEKALSQTLGKPVLLSLSATIEADKKAYYKALEQAQRGNEVTAWVTYFVSTVLAAQKQARLSIDFTVKKAKFFDLLGSMLNDRQKKAVKKMMEAGPQGFEGGMNANKYMSITKTSKATATRDLQQLAELGALTVQGGGRSTHYHLSFAE